MPLGRDPPDRVAAAEPERAVWPFSDPEPPGVPDARVSMRRLRPPKYAERMPIGRLVCRAWRGEHRASLRRENPRTRAGAGRIGEWLAYGAKRLSGRPVGLPESLRRDPAGAAEARLLAEGPEKSSMPTGYPVGET